MTRYEKYTIAFFFAFLSLVGLLAYRTLGEITAARAALEEQGATLGTFNFVSSGSYTLSGGGVASSDTSITVDNFLKPVSEIQYTMANDFGDIGYLTLEPGSATNKEFVSFTGFSYSGNRATFTGVTRGLEFNYPYTASSTLRKSHAGGSRVIVSNPPQLYNQLSVKQNDEHITGNWTFASTNTPAYNFNPTWSSEASTTLASKGFVEDTANAGAADASETTKGIGELATEAEAGAGTSLGATGARLVLPASLATSTPTASCSAFCVVVAAAGKIAQTFLDLTAAFSWSGLHTFSGGILSTASSTLAATTTIPAASVNTNPLILNSIPYAFPGTQGASSSILATNGAGVLSWNPSSAVIQPTSAVGATSTSLTLSNSTTETTYDSAGTITVPGGKMGSAGTLRMTLHISDWDWVANATANNSLTIRFKLGGTSVCTLTSTSVVNAASNNKGIAICEVLNTSAATQVTFGSVLASGEDGAVAAGARFLNSVSTASIDTATSKQVTATIQWTAANSGNSITVNGLSVVVY